MRKSVYQSWLSLKRIHSTWVFRGDTLEKWWLSGQKWWLFKEILVILTWFWGEELRSIREDSGEHKSWESYEDHTGRDCSKRIKPRRARARAHHGVTHALTSLSHPTRGTPIFYFRYMSARPLYISVTKLNISIADKMLFYY